MPGPDAYYREQLSAGRFMLQRERKGTFHYPPRAVAPGTGSEELEWVEASGKGTVYSVTTVHRRPPEPSYNVALVDLAEGPRMMSRIEGLDPSEIRIGLPVLARIVDLDGASVVIFGPES